MAMTGVNINLAAAPVKVEDPAVQMELENLYAALHLLNSIIFDKNMMHLPQYTTAGRPTAVAGVLIYDSTLNKAVLGTGAGTWEVVTSV